MGVRAPLLNEEALRSANQRLDGQISRIYLLWLVGLIVGVVGVRPEKAELGGLAFKIENPDVLQGLIFLVCLLYYVAVLAYAIGVATGHTWSTVSQRRRVLYAALGAKKTLAHHNSKTLAWTKIMARVYATFGSLFTFVWFVLPFIQIVFIERIALFRGMDAMFNASSVKNDIIDLWSAPAIGMTALLLFIWTGLIDKAFGRWFSSQKLKRVVQLFLTSTITYSGIEFLAEGARNFEAIFKRIAVVQLGLFGLLGFVIAVILVVVTFHFWSGVRAIVRRQQAAATQKALAAPDQGMMSKSP